MTFTISNLTSHPVCLLSETDVLIACFPCDLVSIPAPVTGRHVEFFDIPLDNVPAPLHPKPQTRISVDRGVLKFSVVTLTFDLSDVINKLPDPIVGTFFIVPKAVCDAMPNRRDFIYPRRGVQDSEGNVCCTEFGCVSAPHHPIEHDFFTVAHVNDLPTS